MVPSAYLRVFRPLHTYPDHERSLWERYIVAGATPPPTRRVYREQSSMAERRVGLLASTEGDYADIRLVDGQYYVCPWRTRLRVLASILSLRESSSPEVADAFVSQAEVRRAERELARLKRREPSAVPCMLQSAWHVPIRWFVLVDQQDKRLVRTSTGDLRLYYRTPITSAKRRAQRALQILGRSDMAPVAELVRDLLEWLCSFDRRSMVELDYGTVSSLFSWDELDNDQSASEIQMALQALSTPGGMAKAAELYEGVAGRWAEARARESLN